MTEKPEGNSYGPQQLAAILGVLFVAAWAALGFADALLCLIGAAVFYLATAIAQLRSGFPNPSVVICNTCARSNDVPGGEALGYMRLIYRNFEPRRPSTAAHPTEG